MKSGQKKQWTFTLRREDAAKFHTEAEAQEVIRERYNLQVLIAVHVDRNELEILN